MSNMTPHDELRQFAAMAMQGILTTISPHKRFDEYSVATVSIECALALQQKLDELRPKPCEHKNTITHSYQQWDETVCNSCGVKL